MGGLGATPRVAAANARRYAASHGYALADLVPGSLPELAECTVPRQSVVDVVTPGGVAAVGLPATYPLGVDHPACQPIGQAAFDAGEQGIASRSAAEAAGGGPTAGEELALFHRGYPLVTPGARRRFADWYPAA